MSFGSFLPGYLGTQHKLTTKLQGLDIIIANAFGMEQRSIK